MVNIFSWLQNYWGVVVIVLAVIVYALYELIIFYKLPNSEKVKRIKAVLYSLVIKFSAQYDEGMYDIIFANVYDEFCSKFPVLKSIIPLDVVKQWVNEAFDNLKGYLTTQGKTLATLHNPNVK